MYDFYLMHENTKVLKFNITADINIFTNLCEFEIINKRYLPYPVKLAKEEDRCAKFWLWFTTRYMDRQQEGFLDFTNFYKSIPIEDASLFHYIDCTDIESCSMYVTKEALAKMMLLRGQKIVQQVVDMVW